MAREHAAVIDQLRHLVGDDVLEATLFATERQRFERTMRVVQHHGRRRLVHLTRFDTDQSILDMVYATHAVRPGQLVQARDERHRIDALGAFRLIAQCDGHAPLEIDRDVGRFLGSEAGIDGPRVRVFGWLIPGIFEHARFDAAAP